MKVILIKDVAKLGRRFDVKDVASGYAQNLLIPKGEAIAATPAALKRNEAEKSKIEGSRKIHEELTAKNLKAIEGVTVSIKGKASEKGHLFAGIGKDDIVSELRKQASIDVDESFIDLEHPIKEVGNHVVTIKAQDKSAKLKIVIEGTK